MTYRIELRPAAIRALKRVDPQDRDRIRGVIALLGEEPRPPGTKALRGRPGFRVRVGKYRIIYTVQDDVLLVVVMTLGHRKDVYGARKGRGREWGASERRGPSFCDGVVLVAGSSADADGSDHHAVA